MKFVSGYLESVYRKLKEEYDDVVLRRSSWNVPHVVVTTDTCTFSVCYFKGSRIYRVFSPYPSHGMAQVKENLSDAQDVVRYIRDY